MQLKKSTSTSQLISCTRKWLQPQPLTSKYISAAQCRCLLHTGCLSFREHVYRPDGLQGFLCPKQNGFESVGDPHQVWEKVTRILNIIFNAYHGSLCQSVHVMTCRH